MNRHTDPAESQKWTAYQHIRRTVVSAFASPSLTAKVLRGGALLGAGSVLEQTARFGRTMILARLLAPGAFGTMAVVLSTGSVIDALTDVGAREAVVQNPRGDEPNYLHTAWWLTLGRGFLLYAVIFAVAPWIAQFYGNQELSPLMRVALLSIVFGNLLSPLVNRQIKRVEFSRVALMNHGGAICGMAITVGLSFALRDVWALAIGYCAENVSRCVLSYVLLPPLSMPRVDRHAARDLMKFSKGMFGLSFFNLIFSRADIFVLAKLCTPASLGVYTLTVYLVQTPTSFLMALLGQTLLPSFSNVQGDQARTQRMLFRVKSLLIYSGIPAVAFVVFYGRAILITIYGQEYSGSVGPLMVASCVALINLLNGQITTVFYAAGRPQLHRFSVALMAGIMVVMTYPFANWLGLVGGQIACLLAVALGYSYQLVRLRRLIGPTEPGFVKLSAISLLLSAGIAAVGLGGRALWRINSPSATLGFGVVGLLVTYALISVLYLPRRSLFAENVPDHA